MKDGCPGRSTAISPSADAIAAALETVIVDARFAGKRAASLARDGLRTGSLRSPSSAIWEFPKYRVINERWFLESQSTIRMCLQREEFRAWSAVATW